jgi:hypothetical protein
MKIYNTTVKEYIDRFTGDIELYPDLENISLARNAAPVIKDMLECLIKTVEEMKHYNFSITWSMTLKNNIDIIEKAEGKSIDEVIE